MQIADCRDTIKYIFGNSYSDKIVVNKNVKVVVKLRRSMTIGEGCLF